MKQHFYSHITNIHSLHIALGRLKIDSTEKEELLLLADSTLHQTILETILSELSPKDKRQFFDHLNTNDHETIWQFLREKINGIEGKITRVGKTLIDSFHKDINDVEEKKNN